MKSKSLIVPVGTALAGLLANASDAAKVAIETGNNLQDVHEASIASQKLREPALKNLIFRIEEEAHALTLHKSPSGTLFAQHGSHRAHGAHRAHSAHRSAR